MPNQDEYQDQSFTPSSITITTIQFLILIDRSKNGTPPSNGWNVFQYVRCKACLCAWTAVAMANTKGRECPYCGYFDREAMWIELSEVKGEGALLNPVGEDYSIVNPN